MIAHRLGDRFATEVFTTLSTNNPFDPGTPGCAEDSWSGVLADSRPWMPDGGPLVVVSPHPDDEVLGAGGLIATCAAQGQPVTVVSVTDGEAAYPDWQGLDRIRREELRAALRKLSPVHISVVRVGLPDGRVAAHRNRLRNALQSLLSPGSTLVAPYESDGHPDHDAAGTVCCELARAQGVALARYPIWSWHHGNLRDVQKACWRKFSLSIEARRAKSHAVQCFQSQLSPDARAPIVPKHVLTYFERPFEAFLL